MLQPLEYFVLRFQEILCQTRSNKDTLLHLHDSAYFSSAFGALGALGFGAGFGAFSMWGLKRPNNSV
jgi:hypothetical protein